MISIILSYLTNSPSYEYRDMGWYMDYDNTVDIEFLYCEMIDFNFNYRYNKSFEYIYDINRGELEIFLPNSYYYHKLI